MPTDAIASSTPPAAAGGQAADSLLEELLLEESLDEPLESLDEDDFADEEREPWSFL